MYDKIIILLYNILVTSSSYLRLLYKYFIIDFTVQGTEYKLLFKCTKQLYMYIKANDILGDLGTDCRNSLTYMRHQPCDPHVTPIYQNVWYWITSS